jgi:hypothetical protein
MKRHSYCTSCLPACVASRRLLATTTTTLILYVMTPIQNDIGCHNANIREVASEHQMQRVAYSRYPGFPGQNGSDLQVCASNSGRVGMQHCVTCDVTFGVWDETLAARGGGIRGKWDRSLVGICGGPGRPDRGDRSCDRSAL